MSTALSILSYITAVVKKESDKPSLDRREQQFADRIVQLLLQFETDEMDVEEHTTLLPLDDGYEDPDWDCEQDLSPDETAFEGMDSPNCVLFGDTLVPFDRVWDAVKFSPLPNAKPYNNGGVRRRTVTVINRAFRFIKTPHDLRKLLTFEKGGKILPDRRAVIYFIGKELDRRVKEKFAAGHIVHDSLLRGMIVSIKEEYAIKCAFKGGSSWLNNWKRSHHISSRNITRFVSKKHFVDRDELIQKGKEFVQDAKKVFKTYSPMEIYNLDQSGFQKEIYSKRTLAETGSKTVEVMTSSANGTKQSYTVLPLLRADGTLHPVVFIVLAEPKGKFPVHKPIFEADNIVVEPSKSHIMGIELLKAFMKRVVFAPGMPDRCCLLADSWPCWRNKAAIDSVKPANKEYHFEIIPPGTTGFVQPLDVGVFFHYKKFIRTITEYAQMNCPSFKPYQRDNILKMISQAHWTMCSARFSDWLSHAWYQAGYQDQRPPDYETPTGHCFSDQAHGKCALPRCTQMSFIVCGYCDRRICFTDFVIECHRCT